MKHRMSISIDEQTVARIRELLRIKEFRNKSHAVEFAVNELFDKKVKQ